MKIFSLIIIALLMFYGTALAKDGDNNTKKYPPYPNVWGYDLSHYQAMQINETTIIAYKMNNGDYKFKFLSYVTLGEPDRFGQRRRLSYESTVLDFFEGNIYDIPNNDIQQFLNSIYNDRASDIKFKRQKITFSNGHSLEIDFDENVPKHCWGDGLSGTYFVKKDEKGRELGKYSIIVASPNPQEILSLDEDDDIALCGMPNKKYVYQQLFSLSWAMIKLEDDSFILYDDNNLIVRFKQDLTTPFAPEVNYKTYNGKTLKRNLFVIPYQLIIDIRDQKYKANQPLEQGLQDGLIDYLTLKTQHINMRF